MDWVLSYCIEQNAPHVGAIDDEMRINLKRVKEKRTDNNFIMLMVGTQKECSDYCQKLQKEGYFGADVDPCEHEWTADTFDCFGMVLSSYCENCGATVES